MGASSFTQSSFLGGEWSPLAQGKIDAKEYRTGMNVCRNGYPLEEGAWIRRSGTRFGGPTFGGAAGRVITFDFEEVTPYYLEFTDGLLRAWASAPQSSGLLTALPNDFRLATTNDNQQVSSISTANPAVVQTGGAHGWATNDQVEFLFDQSVNAAFTPLLRARLFKITVTDATHFSLADATTGATIDGSTLGWATPAASTVVVARIFAIATPYTGGLWSSVRKVQAENMAIFLSATVAPRQLNITTFPSASSFAKFSLQSMTPQTAAGILIPPSMADGPYLDPPKDGSTLTPNAVSGGVTLTASSTGSINNGAGFAATDVGRMVRLLSEPAAWGVGTAYTAGQAVKFTDGNYYSCIQNNTGQFPNVAVTFWELNPSAASWTWTFITGVTSTAIVTVFLSSGVGGILVNTNAILTWRLGAYSDTTGWPTCGTYYQGRLWLSGAIQNRVDSSTVGNTTGSPASFFGFLSPGTTFNFAPTTSDGTVTDNNGITYTFDSTDTNPVFWMQGINAGIVCGTSAGEWLISAPTAGPITPTNAQAHRGTTYGAADVEPANTQLTISFVQRFNRTLLEYFPDVFSGRFTAPSLSENGKHLTVSGIEEIRYQQELLPIIWARMGDGSLAGATYERDSLFSSQPAKFIGWHRHDFENGNLVESLAVGPSADGTVDTLAMVHNDGGVRHVEFMRSIFKIGDTIQDGWFVDDGVVPSGGVISGNTLTLYGLWNQNGQTCDAVVGGVDMGSFAVSNGSIVVPIDDDPDNLLTTAYLQSISASTYAEIGVPIDGSVGRITVPAVVGFTFTSQGQTLRPDTVEQSRSQLGPAPGKPRRVHQFSALLNATQGISFGTDFSKLKAAQFRTKSGKDYTALQLFSGVYWSTLDDDSSMDGMMCWQISRPYPACMPSLTGYMQVQER